MLERRINGLIISLLSAAMLFCGCAPKVPEPVPSCPPLASIAEAYEIVRVQRQNLEGFKASGKCRLAYTNEKGDRKKEQFSVRIWMDGASHFRLHGDVVFNPRGIDIGTNEEYFWMATKPDQLGNEYLWGRWEDSGDLGGFLLEPSILAGAFGAIFVPKNLPVAFSSKTQYDTLSWRENALEKTLYLDRCEKRIAEIHCKNILYEDQVKIVLDDYEVLENGSIVPTTIDYSLKQKGEDEQTLALKLSKVEEKIFTPLNRGVFFKKPQTKGYENVFQIRNGKFVEQN